MEGVTVPGPDSSQCSVLPSHLSRLPFLLPEQGLRLPSRKMT